jgi:transitional endoplasmic reticulum ATPase
MTVTDIDLRTVEVGKDGKVLTEDEVHRVRILAGLRELGGLTVQDDAIQFEGTKIILPEQYSGRVESAVDFLKQYIKDQSETYSYNRKYTYRPWDGAAAFQRAMKNTFGTSGIGKKIETFFGDYPPEFHQINVGPKKTESVPWGHVGLNILEAVFQLGSVRDKELGLLFKLSVQAPKKYRREITAFFDIVEEELKANSIYRGKAINGAADPGFLDVDAIDPKSVIYADETLRQLGANLWSLLDHTELMRSERIPLKRAVLFEGPYGTGKTLGGLLTAQRAVRNNWTFIMVRPGQDDLHEALQTAQIYAPSVVWFEDIDILAAGADAMDISKLLDTLDGVSNKGKEIIAGFTTNHVDRLPRGVLRPGRIDAIIHVGGLDVGGYKKLVESLIRSDLLGDIDYAEVARAFLYREVEPNEKVVVDGVTVVEDNKVLESNYGYVLREDGRVVHEGYLPAFAREAISRAMLYVIDREGQPGVIETEDLVAAAMGLRRQRELMMDADEGITRVPSLDARFSKLVQDNVAAGLVGQVQLGEGNPEYTLVPAEKE